MAGQQRMDAEAARLVKSDQHRKDTERRVEESRSMTETSRRLMDDIRRRDDENSARQDGLIGDAAPSSVTSR